MESEKFKERVDESVEIINRILARLGRNFVCAEYSDTEVVLKRDGVEFFKGTKDLDTYHTIENMARGLFLAW